MSTPQILVVEDESIVAKDIQDRLISMGYSVPAVALSGEEAVQKALETSPDLILMDIMLKGEIDGVEASRRISNRLDVPIIYLTAYSDDDTIRRAKDTGPFGYLLKPYGEKELHTTIETTLARHRLESRVRESERWLATTLRCVGDGVIATDANGSIKFINLVAESLTGWNRDQAVNKYLADVVEIKDQDSDLRFEDVAALSLRRGIRADLPKNSVLLTRARKQIPVEGSAAPILDDEGVFSGYVLAFRDISERRRAEEELRRTEQDLRQAQKMEAIGRMAGGVAHDFNNLLTAILGNLSIATARIPADDLAHEFVITAERAAWRAAELVTRLLSFSQRAVLRLKPVTVNSLIRETIELVQRIIDPRIVIQCRLDPDLWAVHADSGQLSEVFLNLCLNARDAMPDGGTLTIETKNAVLDQESCRTRADAVPGECVMLRFTDTGHGIPADIRDRIFEPFFTTKQPGKGTGLGLAMVFGILRQHGGWIECSRDTPSGACFDVYLPRYSDDGAVPDAAAKTPVLQGSGQTILLVDDEPMVRDFGERALHNFGYRVIVADDGKHALEIFRRQKDEIDLVILDMTMPHLSGPETLHKLAEIKPDVRAILVSGYFTEEATPVGDPHVLATLAKPFRIEELAKAVRAALEIKHDSSEQPA